MQYEELLICVIIIIGTFILAAIVNRILSSILKKRGENEELNPTNYKFLKHSASAAIYIIGFGLAIASISSLRTIGASMLAGAGMLTVVLGFASQQALSNIVAGIFIVIFKPFKINDRITLRKEFSGIVEDITLRHTVIRNFESKRIVVPNSVISSEIILNSDFIEDKICRWVDFQISFDSDLSVAKQIMLEEIARHELHLDTRTPEQLENGNPEVVVRTIAIGEFSITLRGWAWAKNSADAFVLYCDVLESIKKRFDQEKIEIPYAYRNVIQK